MPEVLPDDVRVRLLGQVVQLAPHGSTAPDSVYADFVRIVEDVDLVPALLEIELPISGIHRYRDRRVRSKTKRSRSLASEDYRLFTVPIGTVDLQSHRDADALAERRLQHRPVLACVPENSHDLCLF